LIFAVEVPPVIGTLLVLPNGPRTWHGHCLKPHRGWPADVAGGETCTKQQHPHA
jgi:hypothetical protein